MQILSCLALVCDTDSVYRMKYICPSLLSALQVVQRIPSFLGFQFFAFFGLLAVLPNNKCPGPPFLKNTVFLHHLLFAHFPSQAQEPGRCFHFDLCCCWERASRFQRWSPATKPCWNISYRFSPSSASDFRSLARQTWFSSDQCRPPVIGLLGPGPKEHWSANKRMYIF